MLTACSASSSSAPLARDLPPRPDFVKPVLVPDPKAGEDVLKVAMRERIGRVQANRVIARFGEWYDGVRSDYANPRP